MEKITFIALFVLLLAFYSCKPTYFNFENSVLANKVCKIQSQPCNCFNLNIDHLNHYTFKLTPYHYFKNNRLTTALFSNNSFFFKNLFVCEPKDTILRFLNSNDFIEKCWYTIDFYTQDISLNSNQNEVVFICTSGKTENNLVQAKSSKIFYGNIYKKSVDTVGSNINYYIKINHLLKINHRNYHHESYKVDDNKTLFTIVMNQVKNSKDVSIVAIFDNGYNRDYDKATVYDMENLFSDAIWLVKQ